MLHPTFSVSTRFFNNKRIVLTLAGLGFAIFCVAWPTHPSAKSRFADPAMTQISSAAGDDTMTPDAVDCCSQTAWDKKNISGPSERETPLAYDQERKKTVLFGGHYNGPPGGLNNETWLWDGPTATWTKKTPAMKPTHRDFHTLAYDSLRKRTVLFGGFDATNSIKGDTWEWDGGNWAKLSETGPSPRMTQAMAYDSERHVTVMFGGRNGNQIFDDTWVWDGVTWEQKMVTGPSSREYVSMAYDPVRQVTVLFGGVHNNVRLDDTWEWDGTSWMPKTPTGPLPPPHANHGMSYGGDCGVVMFGGATSNGSGGSSGNSNETWSWDGVSWKLRASSGPAVRTGPGMAWDSDRQTIVIFGGFDINHVNGYFGDTWERAGSAPPVITQGPGNLILTVGQSATFSVVATGTNLTYQWRKNGVDLADGGAISGSNSSTLTINPTVLADAGSYEVIINRGCASGISASATLSFQTMAACLSPPSGIIAWFPFDESLGTIAHNRAIGPMGNVNGGATFGSGLVSRALSFDGVDDYVRVQNSTYIALQDKFSLDAWIYPTSSGALVIASNQIVTNAGLFHGFVFGVNGGALVWSYGDGDLAGPLYEYTQTAPDLIPVNQWSLVSVTVDRTTSPAIKLYRNGTLLTAVDTEVHGNLNNNADLLIGRYTEYGTNYFFSGKIDELEIFNRTLTPSEITALYNAGSFGKCKKLIRWPRGDFDGDGWTDIAVFRPPTGNWLVLGSFSGVQLNEHFGSSGDRNVSRDYDGDRREDFAVFRPSENNWYILNSSNGAFSAQNFGLNGDVPTAADFDGDGKADIAVFRPSTGVFYILRSSLGFSAIPFGTNGDRPVVEDYDDDGKTDVAVYRPATGAWYLLRSTAGFASYVFGASGDLPAPGDYDGDGKADLGVFRPANGYWYVLGSQTGLISTPFGQAGDRPVPGDYDGDRQLDLAVFRPSTGAWYVLKSTGGVLSQQFGTNGDMPIPASYLPD